jgi:RNA polymerase sigma factor (sigma-70 family)
MIIHYSDESLIHGLRQKKTGSIKYLYKEFFPVIRSIVERNSGNHQDAEDVFHDGLIVLYLRIQNQTFTLSSSLKTYFYAICRNIWLQRLDRKYRLLYQSDFEVREDYEGYATEEYYIREEQLEKIRLYNRHFLNLPRDCQTLLILFFRKVPLKEIAGMLGFKDENYAKTRKYLCKNMLRKKILNDPECQQFIIYE